MKKIGLIYSFNTVKTKQIAEKIKNNLKDVTVEEVNAEDITEEKFLAYDNLILGVPTWFDGELPNYWDEFIPALEDIDLKGKKIAMYGLGDQKGYPENFVDALGILGDILEDQGAKIVGFTPVKEYNYESSRGERKGKFMGLALDFENQQSKNDERVKSWTEQLKTEFS